MPYEKKKILIVEDDVFIHDIYRVKFSQEGFSVAVAENGVEALKKIEQEIPDIILLDIVMPYMDGIETLKNIKNNNDWKEIPVIILTNISEKEITANGMNSGADDYLIKSNFTPSEVVDKVNALLDK